MQKIEQMIALEGTHPPSQSVHLQKSMCRRILVGAKGVYREYPISDLWVLRLLEPGTDCELQCDADWGHRIHEECLYQM